MNDRSYTKLFSTIVTSSIWCEDSDTKVVWVTMLALMNPHGEVLSSIPGLARAANVPVDACRFAIEKFRSPDPDSRTKENEGRRIEDVNGGWKLLNFEYYRRMMSEEERKEYQREYWHKRKLKSTQQTQQNSTESTQAEAKAEGKEITNQEMDVKEEEMQQKAHRALTGNKRRSIPGKHLSEAFRVMWCSMFKEETAEDYTWKPADSYAIDSLVGLNKESLPGYINNARLAIKKDGFARKITLSASSFINNYPRVLEELGKLKTQSIKVPTFKESQGL